MTAYAVETILGAGLLATSGLTLIGGLVVAMVKGDQR